MNAIIIEGKIHETYSIRLQYVIGLQHLCLPHLLMITLYVCHALDHTKQMLLVAYNQLTDTTASISGNDARGTVEGIAVLGNRAVTAMLTGHAQ
jgi:hypothetical protein